MNSGVHEETTKKCRGLNCDNTELIRAHIVPKGLSRFIYGDGPNIEISCQDITPAQPPLGEFDKGILCAECDRRLGLYDEYALKVCRDFPTLHTRYGSNFSLKPFDGDKFVKFVLAVLWRASISSRATFKEVKLGKYEAVANEVLLGTRPLSEMTAFRVIVARSISPYIDTSGFFTLPHRVKAQLWNGYRFAFGGFAITAILDNRRLPKEIEPRIMNGKSVLIGAFRKFEDTPEFRAMATMTVAEARRKNCAPWELDP